MQNRRNYRSWKWRAMYQRRPFYFNLLQLFLALQWLGVYNELAQPELDPSAQENTSRPFRQLPFVFCLLHACAFLLTAAFDAGRALLHQAKGRRLCEWSAFSLVAVAYCLVLLQRESPRLGEYNTSFVSFAVTGAMSFLLLHYLGIAEPIVIFVKACVLFMWIYYLSISRMNAPEVIAVILAVIALHTLGSLLEFEYVRAYQRTRELESSGGSSGMLVQEASHTLRVIEELHDAVLNEQLEVLSGEISPSAAKILQLKNLCTALNYALQGEDSSMDQYSQFPFRRVCHGVFSVIEHGAGCALPLFTDENSATEVVITAPRAIFEIVLFLFAFAHAQRKTRALLSVCCENVGDGWRLRLQVTEQENDRDQNRLLLPGANAHTTGAHNANGGSVVAATAPSAPANSAGTDMDSSQHPLLGDASHNTHAHTVPHSAAIAAAVAAESLAEKIVAKYLKTKIALAEPEFKDTLRLTTRTIALTHDVCSVMQRTTHPASAEDLSHTAPTHKWLLISTRSQDPQLAEFEEKLNALSVPNVTMHLSHVTNKQYKASIAVISKQFLALASSSSKNADLKYLRASLSTLLVLTDADSVDRETADGLLAGLDVLPVSGRVSLSELLETVQEVTRKMPPRRTAVTGAGTERPGGGLFPEGNRRNLPTEPRRKQNDLLVSSHAANKESVSHWINLVKRFRTLLTEQKLVAHINETLVFSVLDDRLQAIAEFKGDDKKTRKLTDELLQPWDAVTAALNSGAKREANLIIHFFIPVITELRAEFQARNLKNILKLVAAMTSKCAHWGLRRLCFWFTTLEEVVNMLSVIFDGRDSGDALDLSLSHANPSLRFEGTRVLSMSLLDKREKEKKDKAEEPAASEKEHDKDKEKDAAVQPALIDGAVADLVMEMLNAIEIAVWDAAL